MKKLFVFVLFLLICIQIQAQESSRMHRIAKIKVDAKQLDVYKSLLNEQMNTAIKVEPGVLSYTAVAEKRTRLASLFLKFMRVWKLINLIFLPPISRNTKTR
jgi:hypothetical protein